MSTSIALLTADAFVPTRLEAELSLRTLAGSDNPLAEGGRLTRSVPGQGSVSWALARGVTRFTLGGPLSTVLPSRVDFVLEAPAGRRLLELGLEVVDYTSTWDADRVEVNVSALAVSALNAPSFLPRSRSYTWRLSGMGPVTGSDLELAFELVQEEVATEPMDPTASTRLAFADEGSGSVQKAVIRVRRFKGTIEPSP